MKRHLAWWIVLTLLSVAWAPFGLDELIHKIGGLNYYPDEEVGLMFGVWLFVWWPCHITAAQREHFPIRHVPDSARGCACPTGGRVCGQAFNLPAIHLREEPDALMSASPGLCGVVP
jgi:hypothetical protein